MCVCRQRQRHSFSLQNHLYSFKAVCLGTGTINSQPEKVDPLKGVLQVMEQFTCVCRHKDERIVERSEVGQNSRKWSPVRGGRNRI